MAKSAAEAASAAEGGCSGGDGNGGDSGGSGGGADGGGGGVRKRNRLRRRRRRRRGHLGRQKITALEGLLQDAAQCSPMKSVCSGTSGPPGQDEFSRHFASLESMNQAAARSPLGARSSRVSVGHRFGIVRDACEWTSALSFCDGGHLGDADSSRKEYSNCALVNNPAGSSLGSGQFWLWFGQLAPNKGRRRPTRRPNLDKLGRLSLKFGLIRAKMGRISTMFGQHRPIRSIWTKARPNLAYSGQLGPS